MEDRDLLKDRNCEVCGQKGFIAGVCSSTLGAFSHCICTICLGVGAENKGMVEGSVELAGGLDKIHERVWLVYYDRETDSYKNYRDGEVYPIKLQDGTEFVKRSDLVEFWEKQIEENKDKRKLCSCPNCDFALDITEENMIDKIICLSCHESFEPNEAVNIRLYEEKK